MIARPSHFTRACVVLAALSLAAFACSLRDAVPDDAGPCVPVSSATVAVPFTRVDLQSTMPHGLDYIPGPEFEGLVRDSAEWAAAWKRIGSDVPRPEVSFVDGVLIVVASREFASAHSSVEISNVRRCRATGVTIVYTHDEASDLRYDTFDRSIRGVMVPRSLVMNDSVRFVRLRPLTVR